MNFGEKQIEKLRYYMVRLEKDRIEHKNRHNKTIKPELEKIQGIRQDVLDKSEEIFKTMKADTRRSNSRVMLKTYIILCALQELNLPYNPGVICNLIPFTNVKNKKNLGRRKIASISTASSRFSAIKTGYESPFVAYDPRMFVGVFASECGLTEEVQNDIIKFSTKILKKCPELFSEYVIKVAAGMIHYYISINGINLSPEEIGEVAGLSPATMSDMYSKISRIDNI